jgi:hypothetical protein
MTTLDTENADRDLTSLVTVLTHTPSTSDALRCQGYIKLGDGTKNLSGNSGTFQLTITVGGQTIQPDAQRIFFTAAVRSSIYTEEFPVPANEEVIIRLLSPNSGDSDVDVTAYLYSGMSGNITQISGDSTAADNLELQYDGGTGIIGDSFPFTQAEGAAIGGGLAIDTTMASVTVIQGSEQNLSNASTSDDSRWTGDDDGSGAEFIFLCTPADTDTVPVEIMFEGYYDEPAGATNSASLQVYNFNTVVWDTIASFSNNTKDEDHEVPLSHAHRAPGSDTLETVAYVAGDVLIKFKQDTTETGNACLLIDRMSVGFVGDLVTAAETADAVWDELSTGHTDAGKAGQQQWTDIDAIVAKLPTSYIMGSSTVDDQDTIILGGQVPDNTSTADSIKLAADASGTNDIYNENLVVLVGGTGAGQARLIADYVGAAKTAAVRSAWLITPDNTTTYRIYPFSGILLSNTGLAVSATSDTITLNTSAQAVADVYVGHTIFISGGTGVGQARLITAYTSGRVATVSPAWDVTPGAAASIYLILPVGRTYVDVLSASANAAISDAVWDEASAGHTDAGKAGEQQWTDVDAILADTDELQTDWTNGGRLDLLIDAIKAVTDLIPVVSTTVATADDANSFTLTAGVATADAFNGHTIMVQDADDSHYEMGLIYDWTSGRVVTLDEDLSFTPANGDVVYIWSGYLGNIWNKVQRVGSVVHVYDETGTTQRGMGATRFTSDGDDP